MTFRHEPLPRDRLPRETIDGRRHYITPSGLKLPSVTTLLGEHYKSKKTGLIKWRKAVGNAKADGISQKALTRGTSLHETAEKYLLNEDYTTGSMPDTLADFERAKEVLDTNVSVVLGVEQPLWSDHYMTAGTADLIAVWGNEPTVIDFKTSKKQKPEDWIEDYFVQASVYALMTTEKHGIDIGQIVVMILVEHEYPQVFIKRVSDYKKLVDEIFIANRKKEAA